MRITYQLIVGLFFAFGYIDIIIRWFLLSNSDCFIVFIVLIFLLLFSNCKIILENKKQFSGI